MRPTGGPRPIGRRGGRCVPVAAARWGGGMPTLRRRWPSGRAPQAAPTRAHAQRRRGAPAGGGEDHRQRGAGSAEPQPRPGATPTGGGGEASGGAAVGGPTAPHRGRPWRRPPAGLRHGSRPMTGATTAARCTPNGRPMTGATTAARCTPNGRPVAVGHTLASLFRRRRNGGQGAESREARVTKRDHLSARIAFSPVQVFAARCNSAVRAGMPVHRIILI